MLAPLVTAAPDLEIVLFVLPGFTVAHPELSTAFEIVTAPVSGAQRSVRVLAERTWLARQVRRRHLDVVHHAGGTAPPGSNGAGVVLSVHDIQYAAYPQYFRPVKRAWLRYELPASLRRARVITTPSEFVRVSLVEELGADAEQTRRRSPRAAGRLRGRATSTRRRCEPATDVPGPFLVLPGCDLPPQEPPRAPGCVGAARGPARAATRATGGRRPR